MIYMGMASGREWIDARIRLIQASLVAQLIKNLPATLTPGFNPWVRKIPWRREWLPTPVFWPGKSQGLSMELQRVGHNWATFTHTHVAASSDFHTNLSIWENQVQWYVFIEPASWKLRQEDGLNEEFWAAGRSAHWASTLSLAHWDDPMGTRDHQIA